MVNANLQNATAYYHYAFNRYASCNRKEYGLRDCSPKAVYLMGVPGSKAAGRLLKLTKDDAALQSLDWLSIRQGFIRLP